MISPRISQEGPPLHTAHRDEYDSSATVCNMLQIWLLALDNRKVSCSKRLCFTNQQPVALFPQPMLKTLSPTTPPDLNAKFTESAPNHNCFGTGDYCTNTKGLFTSHALVYLDLIFYNTLGCCRRLLTKAKERSSPSTILLANCQTKVS